jgi:hypothetical protein
MDIILVTHCKNGGTSNEDTSTVVDTSRSSNLRNKLREFRMLKSKVNG